MFLCHAYAVDMLRTLQTKLILLTRVVMIAVLFTSLVMLVSRLQRAMVLHAHAGVRSAG